jgi:hypothetical protein
MVESKKKAILQKKSYFDDADCYEKGYRDGVEVEKGIVLNRDYLEKNYNNITKTL